MQLKETKTARGGPDCPTLLHYLARVLLRSNPSSVTFIEELPHLEAAARSTCAGILTAAEIFNTSLASVQTIMQSVNSLVGGLQQVNDEVKKLSLLRALPANDRFIVVMQVRHTPSIHSLADLIF